MPKSRPPYPEEFRREAVELVRGGRKVSDVAQSLGVTERRFVTGSSSASSICENVTTG